MIKMKKIIFLFVMMLLVVPIGVSAKTHDYSLSVYDWDAMANDWAGSGTGDQIASGDYVEPGQVVMVSLDYSVGDNPVLGMQVGINYDSSVLEPMYSDGELYVEWDDSTVNQGGIWPGSGNSPTQKKTTTWSVLGNDPENKQIRLFITDGKLAYPLVTDGTLCSVYFKVKDSAPAGTVINLELDDKFTTTDGSLPKTISGTSFTVYGAMNNDVSLKTLTFTGSNGLVYTSDPAFSSGTGAREFSVIVPHAVTALTIFAEATDENAKVLSGGLGSKALSVGANTFNLTVQSQNGTQELYVIKVKRLSNDTSLKTLALSGVTLDYSLTSGIYTYTATVPYTTRSTTVSATTTHENATIKSGTGNFDFPNTGDTLNTKQIMVEAEDCDAQYASVPGNSNSTCGKQAYTLNVTRTAPSNDKLLTDIKIDGTTIEGFSSTVYSYDLGDVSNAKTSVNVTATLSDSKASVSGTGTKSLNVGDNTITLTVTAENGDKQNYTITLRRLSNNANLATLTVTSNPQGTLAPNFTPTFYNYYTYNYGSTVTSINVAATLEDSNATITSGTGTYSSGDAGANVVVTAEDGTVKTYVIKFSREKSSDNTLSSLGIDGYHLNETFSPTTTLYTATVPGTVDSVNVSAAVTDTGKATIVSGTGQHNLNYGTNTVQVRVKAENGATKDYTITITRSKKTISALTDLKVDGTTVSGFSENQLAYSYGTVPFNKDSAVISAVLKDSDATYTITNTDKDGNTTTAVGGAVNLKTGMNTVNVEVTAHDGTTKMVYSITIFRTLSDNAYLSNLEVPGSTISFVKTTNDYEIEVLYETTTVTINATAEYADASVTKSGPTFLSVGDNMYTITVTAEDGTINSYHLKVKRKPSTNNNLGNLTVTKNGTNYMGAFNQNTTTYHITVPNEISDVDITATLADTVNATLTGDGNKSLTTGLNTFDVVVTAASGEKKTYTLNITRHLNSNNLLSDLSVVDQTLSPSFSATRTSYTVTVGSEVSQVMIQATPEVTTSTVTGTGLKNLVTGTNTFNIDVTAEDTSVKTYVVVVTKQASHDSSLKSLSIAGVTFNETFSPTTTSYTASVSNGTTDITVSAEANDPKARSVTGTGSVNLHTGDNTISVTVTAEDNTTTTYTIVVNRAKSKNAYLSNLTLSNGFSLDQAFQKENTTYSVTVPNNISKIVVTATKEDPLATVTGAGEVSLSTGNNAVPIVVTAEDTSVTKTYTINIFRALSDNAFLSGINSSDGVITPAFDKDQTTGYTLTVPYEVENADLVGVPEDSTATVVTNGNQNLAVGVNHASILVTAENGTVKTYYVDITRQPSSNNYLSSLEVLDSSSHNYISVFNKTTMTYPITVSNSIDEVTINATAEDTATTVKGTGKKKLSVGENTFTVESISANGVTRNYIIKIKREENSDTSLSSLEVVGYSITPEFSSTTYSYSLNVENNVSNVEITATPSASTTNVSGVGTKNLVTGLNTFNVEATAENGDSKTYVIVINKASSSNNYLSSLEADQPFTPAFDKEQLEYDMTVPNQIDTINIQAIAEDVNATVSGDGQQHLVVGSSNSVVIIVTAENNTIRAYTIHVTREASSNNYLSDLKIDGATVDNFNKEKLDYTLSVGNEVTELAISGIAEDDTAVVTGNKTVDLTTGLNKVNITVTAQNGSTRVYELQITRAKSSNNHLSSLSALEGILSPTFSPTVFEYQIDVPYEVTSLTLTATAEDAAATVEEPEGNVDFQIGKDNIVYITAVAEDGTPKTYQIKVNRLPQANNFLSTLTVTGKSGKSYPLTPEFQKNIVNYTVELDSEDGTVDINGTKESNSSTVTGFESITPSSFPYVHQVVVRSAGGVERTYSITFQKRKSSNANLKELSISHGTLSPLFDEEIENYTVTVPSDVSNLSVTAVGNAGSSIAGVGGHDLAFGHNQIPIVVTAEDGTIRTYTIDVFRENEIGSTLDDIEITNARLDPAFSPNNTNYVAYIGEDATTITVTPQKSDILAKMSISLDGGTYQELNSITVNDLETVGSVWIKVEGSTTTIYTIQLASQSGEFITSVAYGHDISDGMIKTVKIDTTADELKDQLDNENSKLKIYESDGVTEYTGNHIATGMIVKLIINGKVADSKVIVVLGDVDGNGEINVFDAISIVNHIIKTHSVTGCYYVAADTTKDDDVNIFDAIRIVNHIVKNDSLH